MFRTTPWPYPDHRILENDAVHLGPVTAADRPTFDRYLDGRLSEHPDPPRQR